MKIQNTNFCTHFSSSYIPQGVALLLSVRAHYPDSIIWVMPLDEFSRLTLSELNIENVRILTISQAPVLFANFEKFLSVRSFAESIFSIKPQIIEHVIQKSPEEALLFYLDADTFIFAPLELQEDFQEKSIFLSPHYFTKMSIGSESSGRYNAGLVGFRNNDFGRASIRYWSALCEEWCSVIPESGRYADQKYLEEIRNKWNTDVGILEYGNNFGTWSFAQNLQVETRNQDVYINEKKVTSFHFHGLKISRLLIRTGISMYGHFPAETKIKKLIYARYRIYINQVLELLAGIETKGTYKNENIFPKVGGLRNFLALVRRRDFMLMKKVPIIFVRKN
jgi:hypothetical protein